MANVGDDFMTFLKSYGHTSEFGSLDSKTVSDATVNVIFTRFKGLFEAWMKCPQQLKDEYHGKIPYQILAKAAADPNFTEEDAIKANEEYKNRENATSYIPDALSANPVYEHLCVCGAKFTAEHVASMKLLSESYQRSGYSHKTSEEIAASSTVLQVLWDEIKKIEQSNLPDAEKKAQIDEKHKIITEERTRKQKIHNKGQEENFPEKTIIRLLRKMQMQHLNPNDVAPEIKKHLQTLIDSDSVVLLAKEMTGSRYQKVLKADTKEFFEDLLIASGIDPVEINQMAQDIMADQKSSKTRAHTNSYAPQQTQNTSAYIQHQKLQQLRYAR